MQRSLNILCALEKKMDLFEEGPFFKYYHIVKKINQHPVRDT